jgi:predicted acyl esterase
LRHVPCTRIAIPVRDGIELAADLYTPAAAEPWATLLEALPYRKDDLTASYAGEYVRLADEGAFAVCRVDLRGTGSSPGVATDEYPPSELADLADVIAWIAGQSWSNGRVGMFGTSYSGFNSLQVACARPPALAAVCAIYATDDRYTDDVHYMGGALRAVDLVDYVHYMTPMNVLPPVPAVFGDGWRDEWRRRIDTTEPWVLRWLREQHDGPYWRHGSLRPDYTRITCPTLLVGGWADGYRNNSFRTFEALHCPKALLMGPWSHMSTARSLPGPHLDLVPEMIRWFGHWLRDDDTGVDRDPPVRVFVRHAARPAPDLAVHDGVWRAEPGWPLARSRREMWRVATQLSGPDDRWDRLRVRPDTGSAAWISCAGQLPWGQPGDQRADDAWSLTYDWPVDAPLELLGHARVQLTVRSSAPVAFLSAKLCDVFPDGTSALIARGFLNLCHREGSTEPAPLPVGERVAVGVELEATSWVVPAGHVLRLAVAGTDWPNTWPPPTAVDLDIDRDAIELTLPVVAADAPLRDPPRFAPPRVAAARDGEENGGEPGRPTVWRIEHDVLERRTRAVVDHGSTYDAAYGAKVTESYAGEAGVCIDDPGEAWAMATTRFDVSWPELAASTEARMTVRSSADALDVTIELAVHADGAPFASRRWQERIPRRLM